MNAATIRKLIEWHRNEAAHCEASIHSGRDSVRSRRRWDERRSRHTATADLLCQMVESEVPSLLREATWIITRAANPLPPTDPARASMEAFTARCSAALDRCVANSAGEPQ